MDVLNLSVLVGVGALFAGFLGALTGLGGGVVIVPLLTLGFGVDIRYAIGASLVAVIGTSSGAAAAYVKEGFSNIRIGMFLEVATSMGAITGAFLATILPTAFIGALFGFVLLYSAYLSLKGPKERVDETGPRDKLATFLRMDSAYPASSGLRSYRVHSIPLGFGLMGIAGILSGLLGIGSGALKVIAMDQAMRIPFKVSTTTSNFMIGVTAAASAGIYLNRGYIDPGLSMPVVLGILTGSFFGAKFLIGARTRLLRIVFSVVIVVLGIEMIYNSLTGKL